MTVHHTNQFAAIVLLHAFFLIAFTPHFTDASIDRRAIVSRFNPVRNASNPLTPMQVGNGDFAFGADVTGLQTFLPFAIMSTWGWKNDSFPPNKTLEDIENYKGEQWYSHGRLVQYEFGGDPDVEQWLIGNPNRVNLGRVGLLFLDEEGKAIDVEEHDLSEIGQELDLWKGAITSQFAYHGERVTVQIRSSQSDGAIAVSIDSSLVSLGRLGLFLDFPWNEAHYFSAPFVGSWNETDLHNTTLLPGWPTKTNVQARVSHVMVNSTFFTSVGGTKGLRISRDSPKTHRYSLLPTRGVGNTLQVVVGYSIDADHSIQTFEEILEESEGAWEEYWIHNGFVDVLTGSTDSRAEELQRRIILSRYLMRVNEASDLSPQESGLVNDGWYGKFHLEMPFWHLAHWALWGNWDILDRPMTVYQKFLQSSIERAQVQEGYTSGARWSKMTDPSGRSAPGDINELLIWQQPHPIIFAEYEYRAKPQQATLEKWKNIVNETANWMADFAWFNVTSGFYDLGPPMYIVSEDTSPNVTRNPAFELAYWGYGLDLASIWMERMGEEVPSAWEDVRERLAPLPVENGLYAVYEGLEDNFWEDPAYTNSHPSLVGLHGWLPDTPRVDLGIAKATADKVSVAWNSSSFWGWDFGMLAMSAARNGEQAAAIDWLLHPVYKFDDVGMPSGGVYVPTPYFPGAGGLLLAIAMMAKGWEGSSGDAPGFPAAGWNVATEGLVQAL